MSEHILLYYAIVGHTLCTLVLKATTGQPARCNGISVS